ncbi:hypothetical protein [Nocardia callitridis]|uniref:Mce-associated membrane protein n=1 Tax=Nocardia callitridis TaxID=648753 RepID=A0ABP9KFE1_9NOCA
MPAENTVGTPDYGEESAQSPTKEEVGAPSSEVTAAAEDSTSTENDTADTPKDAAAEAKSSPEGAKSDDTTASADEKSTAAEESAGESKAAEPATPSAEVKTPDPASTTTEAPAVQAVSTTPTETVEKSSAPAPAAPKSEADSGKSADAAPKRPSRSVSIKLSTVLGAAVLAVLVVALVVVTALWRSAAGDVQDREQKAADDQHAEQVATDYAVGASNIDYKDADGWLTRLQANTVPQLSDKFKATAPKLQEILVPLKWTSEAKPIAAKVTSDDGGIYKVSVFLNVNSTSAQSPDGGRMTVTYNVTLDRNADWKISDVGGMDDALPIK